MLRMPLRLSPNCRSSRPKRRGAAAVETAICLPLFVIIVLGTIECCDLMFLRQGLVQAAYEGARVAIVPGAEPDNVIEQVNRILVQRRIRASSIRITPPNFHRAPFGTQVTVEVDAAPGANGQLMRLVQRGTISGRTTMMIEQDAR